MSMTLAIWKWRFAWPLRFGALVTRNLDEDRAPVALTRFDAHGFADEIRKRFGGEENEDAPFIVEVCDYTGHRANWIMLECGWSVPEDALAELVRMCAERGLHLHSW